MPRADKSHNARKPIHTVWDRSQTSNEVPSTYYQLLGLSPGANSKAIRAAYLARMKVHHPDIGGWNQTSAAAQLNIAFAVLKDPYTRSIYDRGLRRDRSRSGHLPSLLNRHDQKFRNRSRGRVVGYFLLACSSVVFFYLVPAPSAAPALLPHMPMLSTSAGSRPPHRGPNIQSK